MAEYIERDKVLAFAYWAGEGHIRYGVVDIDDIENIPAADVVPVVRCKDCKHFETPYCMLCKTRIGAGYWSHDMAYRKPDDFCSYGERKEGEG